jgi:hypothetical protein
VEGGKKPELSKNVFNLCKPMKRMDLLDNWLTKRFGLYLLQLIEKMRRLSLWHAHCTTEHV